MHFRYKNIFMLLWTALASPRGASNRRIVSAAHSGHNDLWWTKPTSQQKRRCVYELAMKVTTASLRGCAFSKPGEPGWRGGCIGSPQCLRTPTDGLAAVFEAVDWSKPGYGELLAELRGRLILCAAGLLVPIRPHCYGISASAAGTASMRRTPCAGSTSCCGDPIDKERPLKGEGSILEFRDVQNAGGCTPLGAAAKAGLSVRLYPAKGVLMRTRR